MVVGWDNRPTYQSGADYNGVVIAASDHKAYLVRGKADGSQREVLAGPVDVPLGRWFFTEVHQRLDGTKGVNELFVDGELESKSDKPNTYGRSADQVRYGMLGLSSWHRSTSGSTAPSRARAAATTPATGGSPPRPG